MPEEMMSTREVAKYWGIHEKQVYALIKSKRIIHTGDREVGLPEKID